jgi:hypothetical protein
VLKILNGLIQILLHFAKNVKKSVYQDVLKEKEAKISILAIENLKFPEILSARLKR